jgi:hypothetical protein
MTLVRVTDANVGFWFYFDRSPQFDEVHCRGVTVQDSFAVVDTDEEDFHVLYLPQIDLECVVVGELNNSFKNLKIQICPRKKKSKGVDLVRSLTTVCEHCTDAPIQSASSSVVSRHL